MSSLISCVSWVRRGVATQHPGKYVLDDKERERISSIARIELEDAQRELEQAHKAATSMGRGAEGEEADDLDEEDEAAWVDEDNDAMDEDVPMDQDSPSAKSKSKSNGDDELAEYNLDDYDDDDSMPAMGPFSNIKGLTYYRNNEEDPYITLKEDDDTDREDLEVLPTDNLIVAAKTEDDISQLEIYVYDEAQENLYAHHDLMLPSNPLCLEWLDFPPVTSPSFQQASSGTAQFGNFMAVGTLEPEIEIWSLDVIEAMYPDMVLGRPDKTAAHITVPAGTGKKKRKKPKHRPATAAHHVGAVLALSWNRTHRNLLASGSEDRTVKLWDLSRDPTITNGGEGEGALRSFNVHKGEVQAVQWNPKEPTVLLTGSYDRTVRTFDTRAPEAGVGAVVGADVEAIRWDPWEAHAFYVSLENGLVVNFDARALPSDLDSPSPARFTLSAHDGAASSLDVNPHIRGCIATGGMDKVVKVWNVNEDADLGKRQVSLVTSRDLGIGRVFSVAWSPDDPLTLAAAGTHAKLQIWDVGANTGARKALGPKLAEAGRMLKEKQGGGVIGVASDEEDSSGDEGGDNE